MSCQFNEDIKQQVADGSRLNDTVINLALKTLHIQFPLIPGFEDTDAGEKGWFTHHVDKFVQILFHNEHWTTAYSLKENEVVL